jgi:hypothetical protein
MIGRPLDRLAGAAFVWACRLLDDDERDAVCGDLAESESSPALALREVLGLLARRQAALWAGWRPCLAIATVVLPVGMLLSHVSRWWADATTHDVLIYATVWDWAYLATPGWRDELLRIVAITSIDYLALAGWSWTTGFVLGSLSRRTLWLSAGLFCFVVLAGTVGTTTTLRASGAALGLPFLREVVRQLLRMLLVLLPAAAGMRASLRRTALPVRAIVPVALALGLLTVAASERIERSVTFGRNVIPADAGPDAATGTADDPRPLWPLSLVMLWPAGYMVATATYREWRQRAPAG